ncbi:Methyltransferase, UbiE/COQ5 family [Sulfitobacter noctilucae]|uniref:class I SAM-dependent methyltransferase n=1 Tax=Sulfitobacter noctilucae TaxID=1342302 RepID=UPI00046ACA7B|nr:class I SAM-dependent methyltransferase [Sulfitobacter noctilucae]KIN61018.1 Methyltransferase, UbiE/COQ5 family [Sulfitobacter noctilucae]
MSAPNTDQAEFWSDQAGPIWAAQMAAMDRTLAPVLDSVLNRAALETGEQVLDIGCGAGTSTLEAASLVGPKGRATGVDISTTLLDVARRRSDGTDTVGFELADAQTHRFEAGRFDCVMSRFGVMFFDDFNAAFNNIAMALRSGGRMVFATWGAIPDNPYFTMPAGMAKQLLGPVPKSDPDAPGPFALRDPDRVVSMLTRAGLTDISAKVVALDLTPPGERREVADLLCDIGPAQRALDYFEADAAQRSALLDALTEALLPYQTAEGVRIPASINFFIATKPA